MKIRKPTEKKGPDTSPAASSQISAANFPALRQFLRGYLHEDWQEEHNSPAEAAQQFCEDASPEERRVLAPGWGAFRPGAEKLSFTSLSRAFRSPIGAAAEFQDLAPPCA